MRNLISIKDLSCKDIENLVVMGRSFKTNKRYPRVLKGKTLILIFEKPSLRTRVSFEVGIKRLGGENIFLGPQDIGLGKREAIKDIARTLSCYAEGVVIRIFAYSNLLEFAKFSQIPVINALTDENHPCQVLGDLLTLREVFRDLKDVKIVYIGEGNNVCNSWIWLAAKLGIALTISSPKGFFPKREVLEEAEEIGGKNFRIELISNPKKAIEGADVVYTDVWASMGKEHLLNKRKRIFRPFQVNSNLLQYINKKNFYIMHCLPAHRGEEITEEVIESKNSLVFKQAENRLYIQMAILYCIYK